MKAKEIRSSFLEFFKNKGHKIIPSASVVPQGDPTLLFVNAGMAPFKDIFLGFKEPKWTRLTDTQKCIRVSGKHNDLEEVGIDTYHHTFFEMLGNWSFGDYYKKEAITYAWELLTEVWKLPKERLFVTYYEDDVETRDLWMELTDVNKDFILPFGQKHNFWEMGKTGPCGPCTEIHYYRGDDPNFKDFFSDKERGVNGEDGAFMEIWNLVFMQYNRDEEGTLKPLAKTHVDTGMGFERIVSVLQGKRSNYDTDLFQGIINAIEQMSGKKYDGEYQIPMRVIADHIRTLVISFSDGVLPSNDGRGYVLRRILRRALRYGLKLDFKEAFLYRLVDALVEEYRQTFPEILRQAGNVKQIIRREEDLFLKTLERGIQLIQKKMNDLKKKKEKMFPGETAFLLYDTYGFPPDLTSLIAKEEGFTLDELGFDFFMEAQKKRSSTQKKASISPKMIEVLQRFKSTRYLGDDYNSETSLYVNECQGKLLHIFKEEDELVFLFDQTVFYGESGGQVGDEGLIHSEDGFFEFKVNDVQKKEGYILHFGQVLYGEVKESEVYTLSYDLEKRKAIRKNHSSVHLIHHVLRSVLGLHVQQRGSYVDENKARLDFSHHEALSETQIEEIEKKVNAMILENFSVEIIEDVPYEDALEKMKALAFFEEKYPEKVRVVNIAKKSVELCGGSHVRSTGEIGLFTITTETSSSAGVRRIEMTSGMSAYEETKKREFAFKNIGHLLKVGTFNEVESKFEGFLREYETLKRSVEEHEAKAISDKVNAIKPEVFGNIEFYYHHFENVSNQLLKEKAEMMKNIQTPRIIVFSSEQEGKISFFSAVSKNLEMKYPAGTLIKELSQICGGNGGGRADYASGAGKDPSKRLDALETLKKRLQ